MGVRQEQCALFSKGDSQLPRQSRWEPGNVGCCNGPQAARRGSCASCAMVVATVHKQRDEALVQAKGVILTVACLWFNQEQRLLMQQHNQTRRKPRQPGST